MILKSVKRLEVLTTLPEYSVMQDDIGLRMGDAEFKDGVVIAL